MCGIAGIISLQQDQQQLASRLNKMKQSMLHRGPDGEGSFFANQPFNVALGHQRLAIIDPAHGKQPMLTGDGRVAVVFNGAIYNYLELRRELLERGHPISSYSDTEVLLYSYLEWGDACVSKFQGMFAFAIWDGYRERLFCARDRIGIKPFYFSFSNQQFLFGSEIKAVLAGGVKAQVDLQGLEDYLTFQYCLEKTTLFKDIHKLEPGQSLLLTKDQQQLKLQISTYWNVNYVTDYEHDESYFVDHLTALLEDSIRTHLRSDVPLGAHLSGGLDSSTVVAMAAPMLSGLNLKTFTGAFHGEAYDETFYAKSVAEQVGTQYLELFVPTRDLETLLPKLIWHMDEPAAGPGVIPQYFVSQLAAKHVKVVLGGQGGDELFGGYSRYFVAYLEKCLHNAISGHPDKDLPTLSEIEPFLPLLKDYKPMITHFWRDGTFASDAERYFRLVDRSEGSSRFLNGPIFEKSNSFERFNSVFSTHKDISYINRMTYFDLKASLPALLQVEDRTSMAASIESRVPILDHRIVELMATVPAKINFANGQNKYLFKKAVRNITPKVVLDRTDKKGFPTPLNDWLHGSAREYVSDLLLSQRTKERGFFNTGVIDNMLSKDFGFSRTIWGLVCLEQWFRTFIDNPSN